MISYNLLSDKNGLYSQTIEGTPYDLTTYSSDWYAVTPGALISYTNTNSYNLNRYSLEIRPSNSSDVVLEIPTQYADNVIKNAEWIFHALFYCHNSVTVKIQLYDPEESVIDSLYVEKTIKLKTWTACYSNVYTYADEASPYADMKVRVTISGHAAQSIFMSMPTLTLDKPHLYNAFYIQGKYLFPDFIEDFDSKQEQPTYPFWKLWHSLTSVSDDVMKEYVRIFPYSLHEVSPSIENTNTGSAWEYSKSTLLEPSLMTNEYMQWAIMFIGSRLKNNIFFDGQNAVFSTDEEIEAFKRWQLTSRVYGYARGSRDSVKDAVRQFITGNQLVVITPFWDGDEWAIHIRTLVSETPGATVEGDTSAQILALVEPQRPQGFVFTHSTLDAIDFIINDPDFGVFDEATLG